MSFPSQHLPARRFGMPGVVLLLCCLPLSALANVELPNGAFHETAADLSVKVFGGWVSLLRTWYDRARDLGGETPTLSASSTAAGSGGALVWAGTAAREGYTGAWVFNRAWADQIMPRTTAVLGSGDAGSTDPAVRSPRTTIATTPQATNAPAPTLAGSPSPTTGTKADSPASSCRVRADWVGWGAEASMLQRLPNVCP
jgi:hypothetical protein